MRENPRSPGSLAHQKPTNYDSIRQFGSYHSLGNNVREFEDSSSTSNQEATKKSRKKKKDKTVETVRKSEEIENYQGGKEIDEILSFIENDGTGRKPKKLPNNNTVDINSAKSTDKNNKRNKERKPKVTQGDVRSAEKKENSSENSDNLEENRENSETGKTEMGNSNEKISAPEIVTDDCHKDIKERNHIIHIIRDKCVEKDIKLEGEMMNGDVTSPEEEAVGGFTKKSQISEPKAAKELINHKVENENPEIIDTCNKVTKDMRNDTNLNNVKQNNMKNPKKKPSNTVPDSGKKDPGKTVVVREPELKTVEPKSDTKNSIVVDTDEVEKESDYYIFTDLDFPKQVEEEFKVVGKKKKKGAPISAKEIMSKDISAAPRVPLKEERRRPQRSITPPPTSLVTSLAIEAERNRVRDLSPSSFPALGAGRQGRQSFRDGRRSSTGDVPKEILIKPQDDSDLESVKSLPASAQAVSPRLQISYAKMAASPKPNNSVSACFDEDQTNVSDLKSAIWKGSLTERRHSIGSSPDGKDNESSSIRQKFGSQELVKPEKEEGLFNSTQLSGSLEKPGVETSNQNCSQNSSVDSSAAIDSMSITETVSNISVNKAGNSEFNEPLESYSINVTAQVTTKNYGANNQMSSKMKVTKSPCCEPPKTNKSVASSKQKVSTRRPAKSVIFLDKGEKDHKDFDIVFGFDPHLDMEEPKVSVSNSVPSSSLQSSMVLAQTKSSESVAINISKELPQAPVIHSRSVSNNSSNIISKDYKQSLRNSKSASFPLEGKNGVKSYSTLILSPDSKNSAAQLFSFISEDTCSTVNEPSVISIEAPPSEDDGCVVVVYGEECGAVLGAESRRPSGRLRYRKENGDIFGCFNRVDVANYLTRGLYTFGVVICQCIHLCQMSWTPYKSCMT